MKTHADSQIGDEEVTRLLGLALREPRYAGSLRIVAARKVGRAEMLGHWTLETPEGVLHRVSTVRVVDGEQTFEGFYRDEADALAVYEEIERALDEEFVNAD